MSAEKEGWEDYVVRTGAGRVREVTDGLENRPPQEEEREPEIRGNQVGTHMIRDEVWTIDDNTINNDTGLLFNTPDNEINANVPTATFNNIQFAQAGHGVTLIEPDSIVAWATMDTNVHVNANVWSISSNLFIAPKRKKRLWQK